MLIRIASRVIRPDLRLKTYVFEQFIFLEHSRWQNCMKYYKVEGI